mmetsp:Transcript_14721/g.24926  ORF Transcript_14721/g.24926 Transcript_14721/m.24926 type:complete len:208 (-) Transcript_14721:1439-2062(-)
MPHCPALRFTIPYDRRADSPLGATAHKRATRLPSTFSPADALSSISTSGVPSISMSSVSTSPSKHCARASSTCWSPASSSVAPLTVHHAPDCFPTGRTDASPAANRWAAASQLLARSAAPAGVSFCSLLFAMGQTCSAATASSNASQHPGGISPPSSSLGEITCVAYARNCMVPFSTGALSTKRSVIQAVISCRRPNCGPTADRCWN